MNARRIQALINEEQLHSSRVSDKSVSNEDDRLLEGAKVEIPIEASGSPRRISPIRGKTGKRQQQNLVEGRIKRLNKALLT